MIEDELAVASDAAEAMQILLLRGTLDHPADQAEAARIVKALLRYRRMARELWQETNQAITDHTTRFDEHEPA